jgi:hypothetical protein
VGIETKSNKNNNDIISSVAGIIKILLEKFTISFTKIKLPILGAFLYNKKDITKHKTEKEKQIWLNLI